LFVAAACGPTPPVESPAVAEGEPTTQSAAAEEPAEPASSVTVEFSGVSYTVDAEVAAGLDGWGLDVRVSAQIEDGEEHAFVVDSMMTAEGDTALRFGVQREGESVEEATFTGPMDVVAYAPGDEIVFTRSYPGPDDELLERGDSVSVDVAIWGTEPAAGGQRTSPELARVTLDVPVEGPPALSVEPLDPAADVPEDYVSWDYGSHKIVITPFHPNKQLAKASGSEKVAVYEAGDTVVRLKGDELVVDGLYYGKVPEGYGIRVDHGKVTVGMDEVEGEAIDKEELLEYHVSESSEHELGGYKVEKSPGASKFGTMIDGDTYKLVLDSTVVTIDDGYLYVDEVCYGRVPKKARIKLLFDEVYVGKKKRSTSTKCP
jgi:hypothetical protein